jgi:putative tryptophan/tyrosine transport system substrate-binding protein
VTVSSSQTTVSSKKQSPKGIIRGIFVYLLPTVLLLTSSLVEAQQPKKVPRIGLLAVSRQPVIEAFRTGLRELGYIEGQNILLEYRYAEGKLERLPELAAELVSLRVDVIVTQGTAATLAVKQASSTIPIVVSGAGDLVSAGLVASLARPGGNVTGSTNIDPDLSAKRLELLKETFPKLSRVAVLYHGGPGGDKEYAAMTRERAGALIIFHGSFTLFHAKELVELATKNRLPTMCGQPAWSEYGGLITYGHDRTHQWKRAAYFVDKILKGAKPAELPVEQPMKFEFIINLKTAKQIGLAIPPNVLARADKVIR